MRSMRSSKQLLLVQPLDGPPASGLTHGVNAAVSSVNISRVAEIKACQFSNEIKCIAMGKAETVKVYIRTRPTAHAYEGLK